VDTAIFQEETAVVDWGKAFQVAVIGLSGVFFGLILLQLCVNIFGGIFRIAERFGAKKDPS
jgi:hypothetical protein